MLRWTPRRKSVLLHAIESGHMTKDEALAVHGLSSDELADWEDGLLKDGLRGLMATNGNSKYGRVWHK